MIIKSGQRETRIQFRLHFQSMTNPSPPPQPLWFTVQLLRCSLSYCWIWLLSHSAFSSIRMYHGYFYFVVIFHLARKVVSNLSCIALNSVCVFRHDPYIQERNAAFKAVLKTMNVQLSRRNTNVVLNFKFRFLKENMHHVK